MCVLLFYLAHQASPERNVCLHIWPVLFSRIWKKLKIIVSTGQFLIADPNILFSGLILWTSYVCFVCGAV